MRNSKKQEPQGETTRNENEYHHLQLTRLDFLCVRKISERRLRRKERENANTQIGLNERRQESETRECAQHSSVEQEQHKKFVVSPTDAIVHPWT